MSPRKDQGAVNPSEAASRFGGTDFSFYEMTADVHGKLGRLEEAVETLKKSSEKQSEKLDKLSEEMAAGKMLLKTAMWIVPVGVAFLNLLLALVLHFWK